MTWLRSVSIEDPTTGVAWGIRPKTAGDPTGAGNIHDLDNHDRWLSLPFVAYLGADQTLVSAASVNDYTLSVSDASEYSVGEYVLLSEGTASEYQPMQLTGVDTGTDILTLDRRINNDYTTAATVKNAKRDMSITAGTLASPVIFQIVVPSDKIIHLDNIFVLGVDNGDMDDTEFGAMPGLTNGVVLREEKTDDFWTLANWKTNGDLRTDSGNNFDYINTQSNDGFAANFSVKTLSDNIIEIDKISADDLYAYIQDDPTDLVHLFITAQGHFTDH